MARAAPGGADGPADRGLVKRDGGAHAGGEVGDGEHAGQGAGGELLGDGQRLALGGERIERFEIGALMNEAALLQRLQEFGSGLE